VLPATNKGRQPASSTTEVNRITAEEEVMDLSSVGQVKEVFTLVDYYSYIKGVEYLICVAFFVGFPMFYRYINNTEESNSAENSH
jgi:hypothetical protein